MPGPPPREEATEARGTDAHHRGAAAPGSSPAPSAAGTPPRARLPREQPSGDARSCREPVASACPADAASRVSCGASPATSLIPSVSASTEGNRAASRRGARGTKANPSANALRDRPATSKASRVLPTPPGPVRVNRRTSSRSKEARDARRFVIAPDQGCGRRGEVVVGGLRRRTVDGGAPCSRFEPVRGPAPSSPRASASFTTVYL